MVSARLVDCPESPEYNQMRPIPEMMFAVGEEPVGVRVLTYQSSGAIKRILNTLDAEEIDFIKKSAFGKLIEIDEKPVFSGRFARYLLSRQLKTKKKHEAWFRYAGNPVRFSLREFAIVTGLPCGPFPRRSKLKLKEKLYEKPYWPSLFGKSEVVSVSSVIKMLRRRTVKDRDARIKYACLSLLDSVLLPTSMKMKICREHADAIEDIDKFFRFPWGRLAFDLLMSSIKERDAVALSQNNIAIKGFALALQLVMVEAVPVLTEVVQDSCSSSESDSDDDNVESGAIWSKKETVNPAHARRVDQKTDVLVRSIIPDDPAAPVDEGNFVWSDEEGDETVDNLVSLIEVKHKFDKSMFVGGLTEADVQRMRDAEKSSTKTRKTKPSYSGRNLSDPDVIVSLVTAKLKPTFEMLESTVKKASKQIDSVEASAIARVDSMMCSFRDEMMESVKALVIGMVKQKCPPPVVRPENQSLSANGLSHNDPEIVPQGDANARTIKNVMDNISEYSTPQASPHKSQTDQLYAANVGVEQPADISPLVVNESGAQSAQSQNTNRHMESMHHMDMPSFSLGLTQEELLPQKSHSLGKNYHPLISENDINVGDNIGENHTSRKSKRQKIVPAVLVDDYQCGPHILSRLRQSHKAVFVLDEPMALERKFRKLSDLLDRNFAINVCGLSVTSKEIQLMAERSRVLSSKVVDILMRLVRSVVLQHPSPEGMQGYCFLDTKFGAAIVRNYAKFARSKKKVCYSFPKGLVEVFNKTDGSVKQLSRLYFPFNIGKKHWVGICYDLDGGHLVVLDCNMSVYNEATIAKHLTPLIQMLPYLASVGSSEREGDMLIPCRVDRPKGVSQYVKEQDSGLLSVLLIVTHAVHGLEACKNISGEFVKEEGKSAAVMAYEFKDRL